MKISKTLALLSVLLIPAFIMPASAQVVVVNKGLTEFCGNWGQYSSYTCMGLSGQLIKDNTEQDPYRDIYVVVVRAWDTRNDQNYIFDMWLETYTYYNAKLDKLEPQAGYRWSQTPISFSYAGISVGVTLPATNTEVYINPNFYSSLMVKWHVYSLGGVATVPIPNPGWSEFAVAFDVPKAEMST